MIEDKKVLDRLKQSIGEGHCVATVTIVNSEGSSPRGVGSTMLIDSQGNLLEGTIGGGILEEKVKKDAVKSIRKKESSLVGYNLDRNIKGKDTLPMICGGNVSLFIKVYSSREKLIIAGAGHISEKLSKMAHILGYTVIVMDDRAERLSPLIFPHIRHLVVGNIADKLDDINIDTNTLVVIVTHGHEHDEEVLEKVLGSDAKYIGMIGSTSKTRTCFENLLKKGYLKEDLSKVYAPIGLDLGGEGPEDIALSIIAQIQAIKHEKEVPHLSNNICRFEE